MVGVRQHLICLPLLCIVLSCASVPPEKNTDDYIREIQTLQRQLVVKPNDTALLRDLGVAYFETKDYENAKAYLYRAFIQKEHDPKTLFYYGMTLEWLNQTESALGVYVNYSDVDDGSRYKVMIEGRYRTLLREVVRKQLQTVIANEQLLSTQRLSPKAVAVFPLKYQGSDERFAPLSKGLSEMMIIDLGQVNGLTLIERIRTEELINELKFGQSKYVEKETAPRVGKLLSAGRVVSGSFDVTNNNLKMGVAAWDVVNRRFPDLKTKSDDLNNLFKIEKEIVFDIIKDLGITLTREERERIEYVPTTNFLAFMNYCLGLRSEDAFDYVAAGVYYRQAVSLDPSFAIAKSKVNGIEASILAGGSKEQALQASREFDRPLLMLASTKRRKLIEERLGHLEENFGRIILLGDDDRKPTEDAIRHGVGVGKLPGPPLPPPHDR